MAKMLLATILVLLAVVSPVGTSPSYWAFFCAGGNFTAGSAYSSSLRAVTALLPGRAAASPLLFSTLNSSGYHGATTVYAFAQCQGDTESSECESCIRIGLKEAHRAACPHKQGAFIFRNKCKLGYYSQPMDLLPQDSSIDTKVRQFDSGEVSVHGKAFDNALLQLRQAVAQRTVTSSRHFATGEKTVDATDYSLKLYAAGQCWPSLSREECDYCLQDLMLGPLLGADKPTASRAATVWCSYRYTLHHFFVGQPTVSLPAYTGEPKPGPSKQHHEDHLLGWALGLGVAGTTLATGLLIVAIALCWQNKRKKRLARERGGEIGLTSRAAHDSGQVEPPSALDSFQQIVQQASSKEIALFLDYDGTLSPIVKDHDKAFISEEMRTTLRAVARCFKTSIVSGRARSKVFNFVGIEEINYAGSHGLDIKLSTATASTSSQIVEDHGPYQPAEEYREAINKVYESLSWATQEIDGASVEHNTFCVSVHYRNVAEKDQLRVREVVEAVLQTEGGGLKLSKGHMVHQIRPAIKWDKGDSVLYILEQLGLGDPTKAFPIHIGDDKTDEDAFETIRKETTGAGIVVMEKARETRASYSLKNPSQVMEFLNLLVKMQTERSVCSER